MSKFLNPGEWSSAYETMELALRNRYRGQFKLRYYGSDSYTRAGWVTRSDKTHFWFLEDRKYPEPEEQHAFTDVVGVQILLDYEKYPPL